MITRSWKAFGSALIVALLLTAAGNGRADTVVVTTPLPTGTNNWYSTNEYVLSGLVHLLTNSVLNIQAGTVVKGSNTGAAAVQKGGLVVCQGGKIFAEGTPERPIIFTAEADNVQDPEDLNVYQRGLWGGVILMGRAVLNSAADSTGTGSNPKYEQYEGLPPTIEINGQNVHRFGGSDDDDNSGVLRYVSIRHAGAVIEQNREINGLSLCAVGRGTTIEFVEAYGTADDGFEFFGGTVNTRYLVSAFNDDDSFDTDQGHSGKHQFWFAIQPPDKRNYGLELNGEVSGTTGLTTRDPISNFQVYNLTVIGAGVGTTGAGGDNTTMLVREFSAPRVYNSIFTEFAKRGIEFGPKADLMLTNGSMQLCNNLWWGYTGGADPNSATNIAVDVRGQVFFTDTTRSNLIADPMLTSVSRTNNLGLDPRPRTGSPAYSDLRAVPNDGYFINASAKGAFGSQNWASDWTALGAYGVFNGRGGGNPKPTTVVDTCVPALLSVTKAGSDIEITFASIVGKSYKLYGSPSIMAPLNSYSEVATMTASGTTSTFSAPTSGTERFFVVKCQ